MNHAYSAFQTTSLCRLRHVQAYLVDGVIPKDELLCPINDEYFPKPASASSIETLSEDDRDLMRVGRETAKAWTEMMSGGEGH